MELNSNPILRKKFVSPLTNYNPSQEKTEHKTIGVKRSIINTNSLLSRSLIDTEKSKEFKRKDECYNNEKEIEEPSLNEKIKKHTKINWRNNQKKDIEIIEIASSRTSLNNQPIIKPAQSEKEFKEPDLLNKIESKEIIVIESKENSQFNTSFQKMQSTDKNFDSTESIILKKDENVKPFTEIDLNQSKLWDLYNPFNSLEPNLPACETKAPVQPLENKAILPKKYHQLKLGLNPPTSKTDLQQSQITDTYYSVMFTRACKKKKKSYEDGILILSMKCFFLQDSEGKKIIEKPNLSKCRALRDSQVITLGNYEVEVQNQITYEDFASGRCFFNKPPPVNPNYHAIKNEERKEFTIPEGALILDAENNVYVEKFLAQHLRQHQKEGIQFMYDCITGKRESGYFGCILADSMGLGKTLQSIALLYTVLRKDSPYKKIANKGIIVAPSSLLNNWRDEIYKWLGPLKLCPVVCAGTKHENENSLKVFEKGQAALLVISYESFRNHAARLNKACDIIVCDEGHRLKNLQIKTTKAIHDLDCKKRILLTGTPLQNSLSEFYACVSFVNPGILGTMQAFNRLFTEPILKGQDPGASEFIKELAWGRSSELCRVTSKFILRRTGSLLESLLPPRNEYLVFCKATALQQKVYLAYLTSKLAYTTLETGNSGNALSLITSLRKIVNHPDLLYFHPPKSPELLEAWHTAMNIFPIDYRSEGERALFSSKMMFFDTIAKLSAEANDKIVVVSNFSKTLDVVQSLCERREYTYLRLDGATNVKKRLDLVKEFNSEKSNILIFLLSCKAGGCGLNLIGANRLILFDPDWNPSNDKQAMGRIWRDGQKKPVHIYRLFCSGTIEEKIYQRQTAKEKLSSVIIDAKNITSSFSKEYLKEVFTLSNKCESFENGDDANALEFKDSFLSCTNHVVDLIKLNLPDWNEEVVEEELDFKEAKIGDNKRKLEDEESDEGVEKRIKTEVN
ncbi:unnamed protein product [Blepharisma stoltei]|uniref:DNA repair and recombination protein RAD54B n=1 Tax=Blepharisma stoltei TaxID=1481888 RepID=A0AAU9JPE7_9CILI|nr:unnamed protein product [Blepharisma stoltei]